MFYKFDKDQLIWKKDLKKAKYFLISFVLLIISTFISGRYSKFKSLDKIERDLIVLNVQAEKNSFTKEKFVKELKRLNIRQPHIVMAQSIIETGHWKSNIFRENHNLFGMREARVRINTAIGTQNNHAYYETWMESIYDYAFYQCRYLGTIKTEKEYYSYLSANYAEDPDYVNVVKGVVEREHLKDLFK